MIYTFDSFEAMLEQQAKMEEAANAATSGWQLATGIGSKWLSVATDHEGRPLFLVYDECVGSDHPEDVARIAELHRGYRRHIRAYSQVVPEGEFGIRHCSLIARRVSPGAWEALKAEGWPAGLADNPLYVTALFGKDEVPWVLLASEAVGMGEQ